MIKIIKAVAKWSDYLGLDVASKRVYLRSIIEYTLGVFSKCG
jgi:hypothetical protein